MADYACPVCHRPARKELPHPDGWIWRCWACTHAFTDPGSPVQEAYDEAYFLKTHRNWFLHPNIWLFEQIQRALGTQEKTAKVLDVGCGRGDLLYFLSERHPGLDLQGIDLAPLPVHPTIEFISANLFSWVPGKKYSLVTSLAVIEHVENIQNFMQKLKECTDETGQMILMTLNEDSLVYAVAKAMNRMNFNGPFDRLYSRHHRHHFTRRSLRLLVEQAEFEIMDHFTHNFPLAAVDFPSQGACLDLLQKAGVAGLFGAGSLLGKGFLQTLVCRPHGDRQKVRKNIQSFGRSLEHKP